MSRRRRASDERGGALLELAIAIPLLVGVLALVFDIGLGFSASRTAATATRDAARSAARLGQDRFADFEALQAVRSSYNGSADGVAWVAVYRSGTGEAGVPPQDCAPGGASVPGVCNTYDAAALATLVRSDFASNSCSTGPAAAWCPSSRNPGDYLGVAIWVSHEPIVGLLTGGEWDLADHAVFALWID